MNQHNNSNRQPGFNPKNHGFIKLDFTRHDNVSLFERSLNNIDQSAHDFLRLNIYLSQDGEFVTIWFGLLDSVAAEFQLECFDDPNLNFSTLYDEQLFRGYIESETTAEIILNALKFRNMTPNTLSKSRDDKIECHALMCTDNKAS